MTGRISMLDFEVLHTENESMEERKNAILSYLFSQAGILPNMMRRYSSLRARIVAWVTGEKRLLIIGGEPASGKSLLMGELTLRFNELAQSYPGLQSPPILISYDRVHSLFLKYLLGTDEESNFLPEGETYPEARKFISEILQHILEHALRDYPKNIPIIFEAPLVGHRGENVVDNSSEEGMQVLITHSPAMQSRILQQEKRRVRRKSAQPLAIRQIHEALLRERSLASSSQQEQDSELIKSWEQWLGNRDGLVLTWDPADDEVGFMYIQETLKGEDIPPSPLAPSEIEKFADFCIQARLKEIPDREGLATKVKSYGRKVVEGCPA